MDELEGGSMGVYILLGAVLVAIGSMWYMVLTYEKRLAKAIEQVLNDVKVSEHKVLDKIDKDKKVLLSWVNKQLDVDVPDAEVITDEGLYRRELEKARYERDSRK